MTQRRTRPLETPDGPERTDLPYEFEICDFLGSIDPTIACPIFPFSFWTEHPENVRDLPLPSTRYHLATGHVINIQYKLHPFGRTWFEYLIGLPYLQRVDVTVRLLGSDTNELIPQQ